MATDVGARTASRSGVKARGVGADGTAADRTIKASAATGSAPRISSGLMSISAIRGWSAAIRATASMTATSLARSTAGWPRNAPSSALPLMRSGSPATSPSAPEVTARAMSRNTSVMVPPRPKATTGPKAASRFMPTMNSRLPATISSTSTASRASPARSASAAYVSAASPGVRTFNTTSCCSVLCWMSAPIAFMATGTPSDDASSAASVAECTRPPAGMGTP